MTISPLNSCRESLERVTTAEQIQSLSQLAMEKFEDEVWKIFGKKYITNEERRMVNLIIISTAVWLFSFMPQQHEEIKVQTAFLSKRGASSFQMKLWLLIDQWTNY